MRKLPPPSRSSPEPERTSPPTASTGSPESSPTTASATAQPPSPRPCSTSPAINGSDHSPHTTRQSLTAKLSKLEAREERLFDLAADGQLNKAKIHERSNAIQLERARIQTSLADTGAQLAIGAQRLQVCLALVANPVRLYQDAPDDIRRQLNQTFYRSLYLDDTTRVTVSDDVLKPPFDEIHHANRVYDRQKELAVGGRSNKHAGQETVGQNKNRPDLSIEPVLNNRAYVLADVFWVSGSSKRVLVELLPRYSNLANLPKLCRSTPGRPVPVARPRVHTITKRLDQATVVQLLADHQAGVSTTQLTATYHLGKGTVLRLLHSHGVPPRRQPLTEAEIQQAIQLYGQGQSLAAVGRQLGCDHSVIRSVLERAGVPRRQGHGRRR